MPIKFNNLPEDLKDALINILGMIGEEEQYVSGHDKRNRDPDDIPIEELEEGTYYHSLRILKKWIEEKE